MNKDLRVQKWRGILAQQSKSGLSKKAFCAQAGINAATFYYWQRRLEELVPIKEPGFRQIQAKPDHEIVVCLPGKELRLRSTSPHTLAQIIEHLCDA